MSKPKLPELLAFARLYLDVVAAIDRRAAQPLTADATMNAYDFRPRYRGSHGPSQRVALKAFKAMGFNTLATTDRGLNYRNCTTAVYDYLNYYLAHGWHSKVTATHLVCAFKHYRDLTEGRITRWPLLKI